MFLVKIEKSDNGGYANNKKIEYNVIDKLVLSSWMLLFGDHYGLENSHESDHHRQHLHVQSSYQQQEFVVPSLKLAFKYLGNKVDK